MSGYLARRGTPNRPANVAYAPRSARIVPMWSRLDGSNIRLQGSNPTFRGRNTLTAANVNTGFAPSSTFASERQRWARSEARRLARARSAAFLRAASRATTYAQGALIQWQLFGLAANMLWQAGSQSAAEAGGGTPNGLGFLNIGPHTQSGQPGLPWDTYISRDTAYYTANPTQVYYPPHNGSNQWWANIYWYNEGGFTPHVWRDVYYLPANSSVAQVNRENSGWENFGEVTGGKPKGTFWPRQHLRDRAKPEVVIDATPRRGRIEFEKDLAITIPATGPVTVTKSVPGRRPPKGKRDLKMKGPWWKVAIVRGLANVIFEADEFIDILYLAAGGPTGFVQTRRGTRVAYKVDYRKGNITMKARWLFLEGGINQVDWTLFSDLMVLNQIEDAAYGRLGRRAAEWSRDRGMPIGVQTGPVF